MASPSTSLSLACRHVQVSTIGGEGSYSSAAATKFFGHRTVVHCVGAPSASGVAELVVAGTCEYGVMPIENSVSGTLYSAYEELMKHRALRIVGEIAMFHDHCLVGLPGVAREHVKTVISHPHILQQCQKFLQSLDNPAQRTAANTVSSCEILVAEQLRDAAAIATREAASLHKLDIIATSISDLPEIVTRYVVVSLLPPAIETPCDPLKCSIAVTIPNQPGALLKTTAAFALRDTNIAKFECQPAPVQRLRPDAFQPFLWSYVFFVDFEPTSPHTADTIISNLREFASVDEFGLYKSRPPVQSNQDWISYL